MKSATIGLVAGVSSMLLLAACQTTGGTSGGTQAPAAAKVPLDVDFSWAGTTACTSKPPAFVVKGAPEGTTRLRFRMTDLDAPAYHHGGGTVAYSGATEIPAGAFSYTGPCPPTGSHDYRWLVQALNADGTVVGEGTVTRSFPP